MKTKIEYTWDHVSVSGSASVVQNTMDELRSKGWKKLEYMPNNRDCDCSADEIYGYRPMTPKEVLEKNILVKSHERSEIKLMHQIAKKYGYVATKSKISNKL